MQALAAVPPRRFASPAARGGGGGRASPQLPTKDLSSSSSEQDSDSDGSTSEAEDDSSAATQFARRLRAHHFDPATIFTAFDQQGTVRARALPYFSSDSRPLIPPERFRAPPLLAGRDQRRGLQG